MTPNSEPRCSIESGQYTLQCVEQFLPDVFSPFIQSRPSPQLPHSRQRRIPDDRRQVISSEIGILVSGRTVKGVCNDVWAESGDCTKAICVRGIRCVQSPLFNEPSSNLPRCAADTFMSKTARLYRDTRTASAANSSGLDKLNDDLQDVTRIMTKNMEELLWRGDSLDRSCSILLSLCFLLKV